MNAKEFSEAFDIKLNSYSSINDVYNTENITSVKLDDYEKSLLLTEAQLSLISDSYSMGYEGDENMRRLVSKISFSATSPMLQYTDSSIRIKNAKIRYVDTNTLMTRSNYKVDKKIMYISRETVSSASKIYSVKPIRFDDLNRLVDNPFRFDLTNSVYRLDSSQSTASQSEPAYKLVLVVGTDDALIYDLTFIAYPKPIILVDLPPGLTIDGESTEMTSELDAQFHGEILNRAVTLAVERLGLALTQNKRKDNNNNN